MSQLTDSRALIALACSTLRTELIPELTGNVRLTGQMIANAMDIALRQLDEQASATHGSRTALAALLGDDDATSAALEARLIASVRAGDIDPGSPLHDRVQEHLEAVATAEVRQSNPRYLE